MHLWDILGTFLLLYVRSSIDGKERKLEGILSDFLSGPSVSRLHYAKHSFCLLLAAFRAEWDSIIRMTQLTIHTLHAVSLEGSRIEPTILYIPLRGSVMHRLVFLGFPALLR